MSEERVVNFSFVIPTFNRKLLVVQSIKSALAWLGGRDDGEIIVVDDHSVDGTLNVLREEFEPITKRGVLRVVTLIENQGVVRAKNAGARVAKGNWLIFLDSDDLMIAPSAESMREALIAFADVPALFFRCEDRVSGALLGRALESSCELTLRDYLNNWMYGECLPVIRSDAFHRFQYDERIDGWEGITYARMMRTIGPFVVVPVVARRYRTQGEDRLSSPEGLRRRSRSLALGHRILLGEFSEFFTPFNLFKQVAKVCFYAARSSSLRL